MENVKCVSESYVKVKEYELLMYVMYNGVGNDPNDKWQKELISILTDTNYQKQAIKLTESVMGINTFVGAVTPGVLLSNSENIEENIMDELLENVLFGYVDKEKKQKIMHTKDIWDVSYLNIILIHPEISLKERFQKKITEEIINIYEENFNYENISFFLMNESIELKYQKILIDKMTEESLWELRERWERDSMNIIYELMKTGDIAEDDLDENEPYTSCRFEKILEIISKKIGD